MPFRNFTLRLYTRLLLKTQTISPDLLSEDQKCDLRGVFLASIKQLRLIEVRMAEDADFIERWRPELRLYEIIR